MSDMRELTTAVNEVAILSKKKIQRKKKSERLYNNTYIKPSVTSNTLSLRTNSRHFVKTFRNPRLTETAALSKAIVSVDNQGLSFGIWGGVVVQTIFPVILRSLEASSSLGILRFFGLRSSRFLVYLTGFHSTFRKLRRDDYLVTTIFHITCMLNVTVSLEEQRSAIHRDKSTQQQLHR